MGWPVSATYSIVSAILGVGIATGGWDTPVWGWNGAKGLAAIWAGLVIAPALAAGFAAVSYLLVKFLVLRNSNPVRMGLIAGPFFFFLVVAVCTMSIIYVSYSNDFNNVDQTQKLHNFSWLIERRPSTQLGQAFRNDYRTCHCDHSARCSSTLHPLLGAICATKSHQEGLQ